MSKEKPVDPDEYWGVEEHSFNVQHAREYGVPEAILIHHFRFWIAHNKANSRNERDGKTWTYCSTAALAKHFPYFTTAQIRRAVQSLVDHGILAKSNYNVSGYDRTTWYAFEDEEMFVKEQVHSLKTANGSVHSSTSTKDNKTNTELPKGREQLFTVASESLPPPLNTPKMQDAWDEWQYHYLRRKKTKLTESAAWRQIRKLQKMGEVRAIAAIDHSIENNWPSIWEPKGDEPGRNGSRVKKETADYAAPDDVLL